MVRMKKANTKGGGIRERLDRSSREFGNLFVAAIAAAVLESGGRQDKADEVMEMFLPGYREAARRYRKEQPRDYQI